MDQVLSQHPCRNLFTNFSNFRFVNLEHFPVQESLTQIKITAKVERVDVVASESGLDWVMLSLPRI